MKSKTKNKAPTFEEFLVEVNKFIAEEASKKETERSYIRLFRPYNTNKINIMGSFKKAIDEEKENGIQSDDSFSPSSKRSFGMRASEQFSHYCFLYSKKRYIFDNNEKFNEYISKNYANFIIDDTEIKKVISKLRGWKDCKLYKGLNTIDGDEEQKMPGFKVWLQKALYAKCLINAYYCCELDIYGEENDIKRIKRIMEEKEEPILLEEIGEDIQKGKREKKSLEKLVIKGVPSEKLLEKINNSEDPVIRIAERNGRLILSRDLNDNYLSDYFDNELEFIADKEEFKDIYDTINNDSQVKVTDTNTGFKVKYFPSAETIQSIDGIGEITSEFYFTYESKKKVKIQREKGEKGTKLKDIYDDLSARLAFYKCNAGALYSGVIPRLTEVSHREPSLDNSTVEGLVLHLGRTSYFTMKSMGEQVERKHPFIKEKLLSIIEALDDYEKRVQNEYYKNMGELDKNYGDLMEMGINAYQKKTKEDIEHLNNYLRCSIATHNINISGNLITKDGVCLYTLRGSNIEDSGDYYPSVNGGSEIYDKDVNFYRNSVEEDIPSIKYSSENVYFGQELTREAIAELGLIDDSHVWNFYGMTCMGQKQTVEENRISFHFNVIGERRCMDEFEHIIEQKKKSAEDFESRCLYGYKLETYRNWREKKKISFFHALPKIIEYKDDIVWLLLFILSLLNLYDTSGSRIEKTITVAFFLASIVMVIYKICCFWKKRKSEKKVKIFINNSTILRVGEICAKICKQLGIKNQEFKERSDACQDGQRNPMDNIFRLLTLMRLSDFFRD